MPKHARSHEVIRTRSTDTTWTQQLTSDLDLILRLRHCSGVDIRIFSNRTLSFFRQGCGQVRTLLLLPQGMRGLSNPPASWPPIMGAFGGCGKMLFTTEAVPSWGE